MPSTPPDIGQPTREARTGREDRGQRGNKWWTLVAVCLGTFMLLLDITIVNVALPDIQRALHSSFADLQWVVDAYALTLASFLLTAGGLADMYGRRVLYLIGLVVFTGASVLCGFATSTLMLQLSRGLQGAGGAIMFAVSLMRGLNAGSIWTHLIPGMIVAGVGVGLVNPPLASTAVGVVPPQQAGMASGINSTFRQVGIATGIALLGTLFSNDVKDEVLTRTAAVPGLSARGPEIAGAIQSGQIGHVIARLPAPARQVAGTITRAAFTTGLDRILLVAAIIAFVAGVVSLAAIRSRDFARAAPGGQEGPRK